MHVIGLKSVHSCTSKPLGLIRKRHVARWGSAHVTSHNSHVYCVLRRPVGRELGVPAVMCHECVKSMVKRCIGTTVRIATILWSPPTPCAPLAGWPALLRAIVALPHSVGGHKALTPAHKSCLGSHGVDYLPRRNPCHSRRR
eukprot:SAG31_NODE_6565_length_1973_cov_1.486126_2_plen_142_part_00